jgi:L-histidine N-alpha-methyltransferase
MTTTCTIDVCIEPGDRRAALERDVLEGLTKPQKSLPPVWFYDERGSELFDEITRLPEYYLTRAERAILSEHALDIVAAAGADTLVELGSGTSEKTRLLLDAMATKGSLERFVPFDVSEEILRSAAHDIADVYEIDVGGVVGDFHRHLGSIPQQGRRLVVFLGSTIGNLTPPQRRVFLADLAGTMLPDDRFLLGTDLVKPIDRLLAAYDDAAGVTAEFNRNVLSVLNAELDGTFDPAAFEHVARWDDKEHRIEMHLRAREPVDAELRVLDLAVSFTTGETLLTEFSSKFTRQQVDRELREAGFVIDRSWTDPEDDFLLSLAGPAQ